MKDPFVIIVWSSLRGTTREWTADIRRVLSWSKDFVPELDKELTATTPTTDTYEKAVQNALTWLKQNPQESA